MEIEYQGWSRRCARADPSIADFVKDPFAIWIELKGFQGIGKDRKRTTITHEHEYLQFDFLEY